MASKKAFLVFLVVTLSLLIEDTEADWKFWKSWNKDKNQTTTESTTTPTTTTTTTTTIPPVASVAPILVIHQPILYMNQPLAGDTDPGLAIGTRNSGQNVQEYVRPQRSHPGTELLQDFPGQGYIGWVADPTGDGNPSRPFPKLPSSGPAVSPGGSPTPGLTKLTYNAHPQHRNSETEVGQDFPGSRPANAAIGEGSGRGYGDWAVDLTGAENPSRPVPKLPSSGSVVSPGGSPTPGLTKLTYNTLSQRPNPGREVGQDFPGSKPANPAIGEGAGRGYGDWAVDLTGAENPSRPVPKLPSSGSVVSPGGSPTPGSAKLTYNALSQRSNPGREVGQDFPGSRPANPAIGGGSGQSYRDWAVDLTGAGDPSRPVPKPPSSDPAVSPGGSPTPDLTRSANEPPSPPPPPPASGPGSPAGAENSPVIPAPAAQEDKLDPPVLVSRLGSRSSPGGFTERLSPDFGAPGQAGQDQLYTPSTGGTDEPQVSTLNIGHPTPAPRQRHPGSLNPANPAISGGSGQSYRDWAVDLTGAGDPSRPVPKPPSSDPAVSPGASPTPDLTRSANEPPSPPPPPPASGPGSPAGAKNSPVLPAPAAQEDKLDPPVLVSRLGSRSSPGGSTERLSPDFGAPGQAGQDQLYTPSTGGTDEPQVSTLNIGHPTPAPRQRHPGSLNPANPAIGGGSGQSYRDWAVDLTGAGDPSRPVPKPPSSDPAVSPGASPTPDLTRSANEPPSPPPPPPASGPGSPAGAENSPVIPAPAAQEDKLDPPVLVSRLGSRSSPGGSTERLSPDFGAPGQARQDQLYTPSTGGTDEPQVSTLNIGHPTPAPRQRHPGSLSSSEAPTSPTPPPTPSSQPISEEKITAGAVAKGLAAREVIGAAGLAANGAKTYSSNPVYSKGNAITDEDLEKLSEALWRKDNNNAWRHIRLNLQKQTNSSSSEGEALEPLLTVNPEVFQIPTIQKVLTIYDNYKPDIRENEYIGSVQRDEESLLVDTFLSTNVTSAAMRFLADKGRIHKDYYEYKDTLRRMWFSLYSRGGGKIGSSGFERVFLSEFKLGTEVLGLHNWIYFNAEETNRRADYLGYIKKVDLGDKGAILKLHAKIHNINTVTTMFIGTSPELEMSLYTVCFFARPDQACPVSLGGTKFNIITQKIKYRGRELVGSAYPDI